MKCIVTGGLGFIGSNLTDALIDLGHEVVVLDNLITGSKSNLNPKAQLVEADVKYGLLIYPELNNSDVIFHLAAQAHIQPSFTNPLETIMVNVIGTAKVLELAHQISARVVYAGSASFYGDPCKSPYSLSKWLGEEECKMYNQVFKVPVAIARIFNTYGPRHCTEGINATVIGIFERQKAANQALTVTGTGEQCRDFIHVNDVVSGLIAMSKDDWNGEIFNLGSGKSYSILEVANMLEAQDIQYIPSGPGEAWGASADISFTKEKLDWNPQYDLENHINAYLDEVDSLDNKGWWECLKEYFKNW